MKVLFFAQCRQAAGCHDYVLKTEEALTQSEFWNSLVAAFPGLASHQKSARLARHETYLRDSDRLGPDDEIAIIPPVSGG